MVLLHGILSFLNVNVCYREAQDRYDVIVECRDERNPPRVVRTAVHVAITDANDNAPGFVNQPYYAMVSVDVTPGSVITKVR